MSTTFSFAQILELSVDERIQLVQDIWDSIAAMPDVLALTKEQREELDRRLASYEENPDEGIPWEEFRRQFGPHMNRPLIIRPEAQKTSQTPTIGTKNAAKGSLYSS